MDSVLGLAAFALVWAGIVHLGKKQNWSGRKRHWMGFLAALLVAGAIGSAFAPVDQTAPPTSTAQSHEAAQPQGAADKALKKLDARIVSVDHMPMATPPRLVLTLNGSGWDEAAMFYGFIVDATRVLDLMAAKNLVPAGEDVVFILRAPMTSGDAINVLHLELAAEHVVVMAGKNPSVPALLQQARVEFNGRHGREIVTAFCRSDRYQGAGGLAATPAFCANAFVGALPTGLGLDQAP